MSGVKLSDLFKNSFTRDDCWMYEEYGNQYKVVIWAGKSANSDPKENGLGIDNYQSFELAILFEDSNKHRSVVVHRDILNKFELDLNGYGINKPDGYDHASYVPKHIVLDVCSKVFGKKFTTTNEIKEAKCWHCGRMNDVTEDRCWHCTFPYPTSNGENDNKSM